MTGLEVEFRRLVLNRNKHSVKNRQPQINIVKALSLSGKVLEYLECFCRS